MQISDIIKDIQELEASGISVLVLHQGRELYLTEGADKESLMTAVQKETGSNPSVLVWSDKALSFCHTSHKNDITIMAAGNAPNFRLPGEQEQGRKKLLTMAAWIFLLLAMAGIIALGLYLSRILSRQILVPLAQLREAAYQIRQGNLDAALEAADVQDELGETCRAFDDMRRELKFAREMQERYEANRKELLAGITHDLATPITSIKGYASGILDGIARTPEKQLHYVERISQTIVGMERLVDSLFLFSKLDLGKIPFHLEPANLGSYFADFLAENKERFAEWGLLLDMSAPAPCPPVRIDRLQFARLVDNLLENSLKYKKEAEVQMHIRLIEEEKLLILHFADNGRGVAQEELPKLFDSFYRTDRARSQPIKGSGLGLAIVKEIAEGMQGSILAEATPGGGLTITLKLPICEEEKEREENTAD